MDKEQFDHLIFGLNGIIDTVSYPDERRARVRGKQRAEALSHALLSIKPEHSELTWKGHIYGPFHTPNLGEYYEVSI